MASEVACRVGWGACCIAPSIEAPFFGMPAGVRCVHLCEPNRCAILGHPERPSWCSDLHADPSMCGDDDAAAVRILEQLDRARLLAARDAVSDARLPRVA